MQLSDYSIEDQTLAYNELKQDWLFEKISRKEIPKILAQALEKGAVPGERFQRVDIREVINKANISVEFSDKSGLFFKTRYRAQMELSDKKRLITIYNQSIEDFHAMMPDISIEKIIRIHLAHEYFHFLEHDEQSAINEEVGQITYREGLFNHRSTIVKASEIGAHMFAKTTLGLSNFPTYYDFQYLVAKKKMSQPELDTYMNQLQSELSVIKKESEVGICMQ
ncbi:hypothetical protein [Lapidilactobacillus luobeiensis]|uniref:hypothetical protein n=1 Tax=Lapidilactobacillus luobeiensis TaxID=2950371 RepID=UPI0021C3DD64|nr:hypothetical protein [Lapidilactobacillus luobeiensis]